MGLDLLKYGSAAICLLLIVLWDSYDKGALLETVFAAVAGALIALLCVVSYLENNQTEE